MHTLGRSLLVLLLVVLFPAVGSPADTDDKPVRLAWFPRFSPDNKFLISAHGGWESKEGGEVRVWEAETGKPRFVNATDRGVRTVGWAAKGKFFVAGDYGGTVHFYDAQSGKPSSEMQFFDSVEVLQISPDDSRLVTAHGNGTVRITEIASKKEVRVWKQVHRGGIWGMRLSPDGKKLATAGKDAFVRIYDVETGHVLHDLQHPGETNGLAFTKDNQKLLTGCTDAAIRVFDVASGDELRQITGHAFGSITDLQFSADGKLLASAGIDQSVRLWDMTDFEKPKLKATFDDHTGLAFGVAISPNDKWLASVGWDDRVVLRKLATRKELWSWTR